MSEEWYKPGDHVYARVPISNPTTGGPASVSDGPDFVLYKNAVADNAVTINFAGVGSPVRGYDIDFTIPSGYAVGDQLQVEGYVQIQGTNVYDIVWSTRLVSGDPGATGGAGTGSRTVTITVNDGSAVLQGALVRLTKGAETYPATTDVSGVAVFNVNDGTWVVSITLAGYTFAGASLVVSATTAHTYSMTALSITPSTAPLTTAFAQVIDKNGVAVANVVIYTKPKYVTAAAGKPTGLILDGTLRSATSDGTGLVQFTNLVKGVTYEFYRGDGQPVSQVAIPSTAGTTYELPSFVGSD